MICLNHFKGIIKYFKKSISRGDDWQENAFKKGDNWWEHILYHKWEF